MKKVEVDKNLCIGCGACMSIASDVFEFDADGLSKAKVETVDNDNQGVALAAESCPTSAIKITPESDDTCNCEDCECGEDCECDDDCDCGCHEGKECHCHHEE